MEPWRSREDSNLRPTVPQTVALSTELRDHSVLSACQYSSLCHLCQAFWPGSSACQSFAYWFAPLPEPKAALFIPRMRLVQRLTIRGERQANSMQEHVRLPRCENALVREGGHTLWLERMMSYFSFFTFASQARISGSCSSWK